MARLIIQDLHVSIDDTEILKGVSLTIHEGEVHALMGPNGNGKSTLLMAIMGHPAYTVTQGMITYDDQDVLAMSVDQRSRVGLFLGMQYPQEVDGVTNAEFLKAAVNARRETPIGLYDFVTEMERATQTLKLDSDMVHRFLNVGFSGGEKKRNEILQMLILKPSMVLLDEIDSGLDVDALRLVAQVLLESMKTRNMGMLVVSHYERFFEYMKPTHAHIMLNGVIVASGDHTLVSRIDAQGYDWLLQPEAVNL